MGGFAHFQIVVMEIPCYAPFFDLLKCGMLQDQVQAF
jgi:hypothetical protein